MGPDRNTEEKQPATTPTQTGIAKVRMELTPKMTNIKIASKVVTVVLMLRPIVCPILRLTISENPAF